MMLEKDARSGYRKDVYAFWDNVKKNLAQTPRHLEQFRNLRAGAISEAIVARAMRERVRALGRYT